jgi:hypothetical protein
MKIVKHKNNINNLEVDYDNDNELEKHKISKTSQCPRIKKSPKRI